MHLVKHNQPLHKIWFNQRNLCRNLVQYNMKNITFNFSSFEDIGGYSKLDISVVKGPSED